MNEKIQAIIKQINLNTLDVVATDKFGKKKIKLSELDNYQEIFIKLTLNDIVKSEERKFKEITISTPIESRYINQFGYEKIYKMLRENGAYTISVNLYDSGTVMEFMLSKKEVDETKEILIVTPGINIETLTVGESYYVADFKYSQTQEHVKLMKIEHHPNPKLITLVFEKGITVDVITRGHSMESLKIMNRVEYIVMQKDRREFLFSCLRMGGHLTRLRSSHYLERIKSALDYAYEVYDKVKDNDEYQ